MLTSVERLKRDLDQYRGDSQSVAPDHCAAVACLDFESLLRKGLWIYHELNRLDESFRGLVHRGELEYVPEWDDALEEAYRAWLKPCDRVLQSLKEFEEQGFAVAQADEFRAARHEVAGLLTPDAVFFSGEPLARLSDEALEAAHRGECEEIEG